MELSAIVLVTLSAISFAALDVERKVLVRNFSALFLSLILAVGQIPVFVIAGALNSSLSIYSVSYFIPMGVEVVLQLLASIAFVQSVKYAPLSETVPLLCLSPIATALLAISIGEVPNPSQSIGMLLVMTGALLLPRSQNNTEVHKNPWKRHLGQLLMLTAALSWGSCTFLDKVSLQYADWGFHATVLLSLQSLALVGLLQLFRSALPTRDTLRWSALTILVLTAASAFGFGLAAIQVFPVALFEATKRGVGVLSALLLGALIFHEPLSPRKWGSAVLLIVGVCLILQVLSVPLNLGFAD